MGRAPATWSRSPGAFVTPSPRASTSVSFRGPSSGAAFRGSPDMPSRRAAIAMSDAELHRFLEEERLVTVASIGPNGRPHLMPLYYVADGTAISMWTFAKSQKMKNLERLPQATLQVEAGEHYHELRDRKSVV